MDIGDLIRYNAVGQKHKSLGLIVKKRTVIGAFGIDEQEIQVHWIKRGELLPKDVNAFEICMDSWQQYKAMVDGPTPCLWHKQGEWLEIVCK